jgi:hypothetical protein
MAAIKHSGSRRNSDVSKEMRHAATPYYVRIFESATNLNRAFDQVLEEVRRLRRMGLFRRRFTARFVETCRGEVEEMRGWANFEVTDHAGTRAYDQWTDYGILRMKLERQFREEAERHKKQFQKRASGKAQNK